jgi:hypothetical protein
MWISFYHGWHCKSMYKGKDFGTPFKKMGDGVRCLVAFEIRSGSYRVSPAKPGEKNFLPKKFSATFCRTYYILRTTCSCIQYVVPRRGCDILSQLDVVCCIYITQYVVPRRGCDILTHWQLFSWHEIINSFLCLCCCAS